MNINIEAAMQPYFEQLNVNPVEFSYFTKENKFISTDTVNIDDDLSPYFIVVNIVNNIGTALLGTSDGINFYETKLLGQIMFDGYKWKTI